MQMKDQDMLHLKGIYLAPYMQLATALIGKRRHSGGNMFRHQIDTVAMITITTSTLIYHLCKSKHENVLEIYHLMIIRIFFWISLM